MQVFDYLINPRLKKGLILKSFYFKPENRNQENLGELCVVAEIADGLSKDSQVLEELVSEIKQSFYKNTQLSTEEALKQGLRTANTYLKNLSLEGNTRWLGNLNLAIINLQNLSFNFSKTGNIKVLLLRNGQYLDIAENLEFQNVSTDYPIQAFPNVVSSSLAKDDKIIVFTQYLSNFFHQEFAQQVIEHQKEKTKKWIDKLIKQKQKKTKEDTGILCFIDCKELKNIKHLWPFKRRNMSKVQKNILLVLSFLLILLISYFAFR